MLVSKLNHQNLCLLLSLFTKLIPLLLSGYGSFLTCSLAHVAVVPVCSKVAFESLLLLFSLTQGSTEFLQNYLKGAIGAPMMVRYQISPNTTTPTNFLDELDRFINFLGTILFFLTRPLKMDV